jgi:hypothetical protein
MGTSIDQVGWDLHWHPVGQPESTGGSTTQLKDAAVQECLGFAFGAPYSQLFRTRGWGLIEHNGAFSANTNYSGNVWEVCQDEALFTGTLSS